uniref:TATA-binding protein-associated factor BTAF1 n=1 Tax=Tanacetum cinerariifolium TaxID=118510 RepID=A0A699J0B1_TANCI|nr:TATA-binding protein-associated factor BTAF1 [Tanacetum cinerariifolium]
MFWPLALPRKSHFKAAAKMRPVKLENVVWKSELLAKLNPIILPLMSSIKREREDTLQTTAAEALAELIYHCVLRKPGPNDKLVKNLCGLICLDPSETPQAGVLTSLEIIEEQDLLPFGNNSNKAKPKVHMFGSEDRSKVKGFICRRGSEFALKHLCNKFGSSLFEKLPKLWDCLIEVLKPIPPEDEGNGLGSLCMFVSCSTSKVHE